MRKTHRKARNKRTVSVIEISGEHKEAGCDLPQVNILSDTNHPCDKHLVNFMGRSSALRIFSCRRGRNVNICFFLPILSTVYRMDGEDRVDLTFGLQFPGVMSSKRELSDSSGCQ